MVPLVLTLFSSSEAILFILYRAKHSLDTQSTLLWGWWVVLGPEPTTQQHSDLRLPGAPSLPFI